MADLVPYYELLVMLQAKVGGDLIDGVGGIHSQLEFTAETERGPDDSCLVYTYWLYEWRPGECLLLHQTGSGNPPCTLTRPTTDNVTKWLHFFWKYVTKQPGPHRIVKW